MSLSLFISRFNNYIDISAARFLNPSSLGCPNGIRTCNVMNVSDFLTLNIRVSSRAGSTRSNIQSTTWMKGRLNCHQGYIIYKYIYHCRTGSSSCDLPSVPQEPPIDADYENAIKSLTTRKESKSMNFVALCPTLWSNTWERQHENNIRNIYSLLFLCCSSYLVSITKLILVRQEFSTLAHGVARTA